MNNFLKFLSFFFGAVFSIFLFLSISLMIRNPFISGNNNEGASVKKYNYAFFLPKADASFIRSLRQGAADAAKSLDCAVSFHPIDSDPLSFEMACFSGFDGFGLYLYEDDKKKLQQLSEILKKGIPVVQIENEVTQSPGSFFIGTNNFDVGKGIARLALETGRKKINMVLVYSKKNPGVITDGRLIEMGIKSVMGERLSVLRTEETSLNPLDAEILVHDLLNEESSIDIIVLTDYNDTLVTVQSIIDMNLVGVVNIIGFGDHETIKSYIDKGVILGSIVRNPYRIGFSTVMALKEISENGYTSAYVDTGITILSGRMQ